MVLKRVVLVVVVGGWMMSPLVAVAAPAEVLLVGKIHERFRSAAQQGPSGEVPPALVEGVHQELLGVAKEVLAEKKLWRQVETRFSVFDAALRKQLTESIGRVLQEEDHGKRWDKAYELVRQFTTRRFVENEIARWLGFPPVGELSGQEVSKEPVPLGDQVVFKAKKGLLWVNAKKTTLIRDVGGAGTGNFVIDSGEWVKLGIYLQNNTAQPFFSSTAWVSSKHPCLWSDASKEHPLAEMAPGDGVSLEVWMYISGKCGSRRPHRLLVEVKDTHRGSGHRLMGRVTVSQVATARFGTVSFDSDGLGSSDGSRREFHPGQQFELSSTLVVPSTEGLLAHQFYAFPQDTRGLFQATTFRESAMVKASSTRLRGGDDVDVEVRGTSQYRQRLSELDRSRDWVLKSRLLWVAIEVPMRVGSGSSDQRVCSMKVTSKVWTAMQLIELLRKNIRLESRRGRPLLKRGRLATDGYEIVIDEAAFAREYSRRIEREVCTDKSTGKPVPAPSDNAPYVFRYYTYLNVPDLEPVASPRVKVRIPEQRPGPGSGAEPQGEFEFPAVRVDLASGWGMLENIQPAAAPWDPGQVVVWPLLFTSRVSIGSVLVGVMDFGVGSAQGINGAGWGVDVETMHAGTGIGYVHETMGVEVQPRIMVEWSRRTVPIGGGFGTVERSSWGVGLGASARKVFGRLGVHLDASYLADGIGPVLVPDDEETAIMEAGMMRLVGGVSVRFE